MSCVLAYPWAKLNQKYKREWDIRVQASTSSIGMIYSALTDKFSLQNSVAFKVVKTLQTKIYFMSVNCQISEPDAVHLMGMILFQANVISFLVGESPTHSPSDIS